MSSVDNFNSGLAHNIRNNKIASAVNQINNSMAELAALRDAYMSELVPMARRGREISDPTPEQYSSILNLSQIDNTPATTRQQRRLRRNAEEYFSQQPSSEQIVQVQGSTPYSPAQSNDQRQELAERYINDDSDWFGYISGVETKGLGQPRRLKNLTEEFESNYGKYFSDKNSAEYKRALGDYIMGLNTEMRQAANSRYGNDALKTRSFSIGMGVRGNQPATEQPAEQQTEQTTEQTSPTEQTPEVTQEEQTTGYKPSLKASKGNGTADWGEEGQEGTKGSKPTAKPQVASTSTAPTVETKEDVQEEIAKPKYSAYDWMAYDPKIIQENIPWMQRTEQVDTSKPWMQRQETGSWPGRNNVSGTPQNQYTVKYYQGDNGISESSDILSGNDWKGAANLYFQNNPNQNWVYLQDANGKGFTVNRAGSDLWKDRTGIYNVNGNYSRALSETDAAKNYFKSNPNATQINVNNKTYYLHKDGTVRTYPSTYNYGGMVYNPKYLF